MIEHCKRLMRRLALIEDIHISINALTVNLPHFTFDLDQDRESLGLRGVEYVYELDHDFVSIKR